MNKEFVPLLKSEIKIFDDSDDIDDYRIMFPKWKVLECLKKFKEDIEILSSNPNTEVIACYRFIINKFENRFGEAEE